ncbi:MAG TPA: cyclic nucleotide-binding domain-containing protein [Solirubrobacteraceae bacterium]
MTSTSEQLLREVPLFEGLDVRGLAELLTPRELEPGQALWRQGQAADALYVIASGRVAVTARLLGEQQSALAELGPRDVLGELALLDGGTRTAGVRALELTRLLSLSLADFRAVVLSRDQGARELRRRLTGLACSRLGARHRALAATLAGRPPEVRPALRRPTERPDPAYLLRLPFFRNFRRVELDALLAGASIEQVQAGDLLLAEGERSAGLFVTLNGAVEEVIRRNGHTIRLALLGPGRGFGYAGLIAGGATTAAAAARERSVVLVIAPHELEHELEHDPFASAIDRDIVSALRQAERPQAPLAARGGTPVPSPVR